MQMRKQKMVSSCSKIKQDPDLMNYITQLYQMVGEIKSELKMHRWVLGLILTIVLAILTKLLI